jgi:hypothetical protein
MTVVPAKAGTHFFGVQDGCEVGPGFRRDDTLSRHRFHGCPGSPGTLTRIE